MADGFIVRKGGVTTEQALAPTITEVSTTTNSITFTITNNDASTAVILYELDDATPDANSIELAAAATSSNIVVTGLAEDTAFDVYATANVTGKVKSNVTELEISTDVPIVFTAATGGTTLEYDSGGKRFKSHTFTSSGTFTVSTVGDATGDRNKVDYLIIAGGAGGGEGGGASGGGGGAGGFRTTVGTQGGLGTLDPKKTVTATAFTITVGLGGDRGVSGVNNSVGLSGNNTSALGETATGGGGGGSFSDVPLSGGSGGGAGGQNVGTISGAAGIANQGFAGGNAASNASPPRPGAGGGGAGQVGQNSIANTTSGNGGSGLANLIRTGSNETRSGGGGAGVGTGGTPGSGGSGGGGNGATRDVSSGTNGTVNTGSGGGGGSNSSFIAGNGGSGLVVIRYEIATV